MHLANSEGVHFCRIGNRFFFLDSGRDRYVGTSEETGDALIRAIEGRSILGFDETKLEPLLTEGLVCISDDPARHLSATTRPPAREAWGVGSGAGLCLILAAIRAQRGAAADIRRRGFRPALDARTCTLRPWRRGVPAARIIAAFRVSDMFVSADKRCLMKSLALYELLRKAGHAPSLLIGVRDYPFSAHAWVELDQAVANDTADNIRLYQPVMVV